jgi:hypothetical protein
MRKSARLGVPQVDPDNDPTRKKLLHRKSLQTAPRART